MEIIYIEFGQDEKYKKIIGRHLWMSPRLAQQTNGRRTGETKLVRRSETFLGSLKWSQVKLNLEIGGD